MKYKFKKLVVRLRNRLAEIVADRRIDKLKAGKTKTIPMDEVLAKAGMKY